MRNLLLTFFLVTATNAYGITDFQITNIANVVSSYNIPLMSRPKSFSLSGVSTDGRQLSVSASNWPYFGFIGNGDFSFSDTVRPLTFGPGGSRSAHASVDGELLVGQSIEGTIGITPSESIFSGTKTIPVSYDINIVVGDSDSLVLSGSGVGTGTYSTFPIGPVDTFNTQTATIASFDLQAPAATAVPEPASVFVWLALLGCTAFVFRRRSFELQT